MEVTLRAGTLTLTGLALIVGTAGCLWGNGEEAIGPPAPAPLRHIRELPPQADRHLTIVADQDRGPVWLLTGFLHGLHYSGKTVPDHLIRRIKTQYWRSSLWSSHSPPEWREAFFHIIDDLGIPFCDVLSDECWYELPGGDPPRPWEDFDAYYEFVYNLVTKFKREGHSIRYWEVWNEPHVAGPFWHETPELFFETFKVAHDAIRAADPQAWVGGSAWAAFPFPYFAGAVDLNITEPPSVAQDLRDCMYRGRYNKLVRDLAEDQDCMRLFRRPEPLYPAPESFVSFVDFLCYCQQHNIQLDFLVWHSNNARPELIPEQAAVARKLVGEEFADLGIKEYHINEWGRYDIGPGTQVAFFYYLDQAGITRAAKAVYGPWYLDGILADPTTTKTAYWAWAAYADGVGVRLVTRTDDKRLVALASRGEHGTVRVVIGRAKDPSGPRPPVKARVMFRGLPFKGPTAEVTILHLPSEDRPFAEEELTERTYTEEVSVVGRSASLILPSVEEDEVYSLTLR